MFTYIVDLANRMSENMDVIIAYSIRAQTPNDFEKYFNENVKLIRVKNFTRNINPLKDIKATFEVRKIIKNEKPDIVHMHSSKAGAIGRLAIWNKNIKLFYTPHSYSFCKKDDSKLKIRFYKLIEYILGKRQCITIACSKGEYEESKKVTKNSMYINNGVNIEDIEKYIYKEQERITDVKNLKICTVGRIGNQKNPKLFNTIAEKFPENQFMWIGDGNLKDVLISPNIKVTGWLDRENTIKQLYKCDIFLLPSLWEGLPITLLEAMCLKKICIVSDVIGNRDVIENGVDGFVCKVEEEYYNIINKIKNNEIDFIKMKDKAKNKVINEYNLQDMAQKYKEIYSKGDGCY